MGLAQTLLEASAGQCSTAGWGCFVGPAGVLLADRTGHRCEYGGPGAPGGRRQAEVRFKVNPARRPPLITSVEGMDT